MKHWFWLLLLAPILGWAKQPTLVLSGPPAIVSVPLVQMVASGALDDIADKVEFQLWKNPDQMRLMAIGKKADFIAVPSSVAANLYNRGVDIKLLNISAWGILYILSRDQSLTTLADFKGKEIAMPFRADMPDLIFNLLASKQGLDAKQDFNLRYVASPMDAMQLLIMRRVDHALLVEPVISMALRKTGSFPLKLVAPDLYRSLDLQQEWGRVFERPARIPQAGIAAVGQQNTILQNKILKAYSEALSYCQANPRPCAEATAQAIPVLDADAIEDAIQHSGMEALPTSEVAGELQFFYQQLFNQDPAILGGKLPDDKFYF